MCHFFTNEANKMFIYYCLQNGQSQSARGEPGAASAGDSWTGRGEFGGWGILSGSRYEEIPA
jgi:hypothetical protein